MFLKILTKKQNLIYNLRLLLAKFTTLGCVAFLLFSCNYSSKNKDIVSWYINPKQNDAQNIYGVAYGANLEEATKAALANAAAKLNVSISSNSTLLREENRFDINEENREKIEQNIAKIDFGNFKVSKSQEQEGKIFVEVKINRENFVKNQQENITFLQQKIANLEKNLNNSNIIQKRILLVDLINFCKELELKSIILQGLGENIDLKNILNLRAKFENQLSLLSNKIEFYIDLESTKELSQIIKNNLTKNNFVIAKNKNFKAKQIKLNIKSSSQSEKIYSTYITKLHIDFENSINGQIIAASSIDLIGNSVIDEKNSYLSALKSLENKIAEQGILQIIGIIN